MSVLAQAATAVGASFLLFLLLFVVAIVLASAVRVLREYERIVIFRLGRLQGIKGPGLVLIIPILDKTQKIDLRVSVIDVPKQRIVTKDNITVDVDAVVYYRVFDPVKAVVQVQNYFAATALRAQTTLRDIIGQMEMDALLSQREVVNQKMQRILDEETDPWGVKVSSVTIKDVSLPESMVRAMAKQAEAERERRSRIIMADGEFQASQKMMEASEMYTRSPMAMKLRELQTLQEIAREKNLIIISPSGGNMGDAIAVATAANRRRAGES
ncbi:MAG TPA: slipin family protein [Candidatus Thermoplasmatota archaeon]|nr:slipin family protein [Candidatus Thermoplasmatota archaeon]